MQPLSARFEVPLCSQTLSHTSNPSLRLSGLKFLIFEDHRCSVGGALKDVEAPFYGPCISSWGGSIPSSRYWLNRLVLGLLQQWKSHPNAGQDLSHKL